MVRDLVAALLRSPGDEHARDDPRPVVHLFGGPYVTMGEGRLAVPEGSKRLLVFAALHPRRLERRCVAGTLWPHGDDVRASGNLRSALWRLNGAGLPLIVADKHGLVMRSDVIVDVQLVSDWTLRLIRGGAGLDDLELLPDDLEAFDLLPGWYDDWALLERERLRQRLLHAFEVLSRLLVAHGRCAEAVEAAMVAVTTEPLRETAQTALVQAHLAEGNWGEARRSYLAYRDVLWRELGIVPGRTISDLVRAPHPRRLVSASAASAPQPN